MSVGIGCGCWVLGVGCRRWVWYSMLGVGCGCVTNLGCGEP